MSTESLAPALDGVNRLTACKDQDTTHATATSARYQLKPLVVGCDSSHVASRHRPRNVIAMGFVSRKASHAPFECRSSVTIVPSTHKLTIDPDIFHFTTSVRSVCYTTCYHCNLRDSTNDSMAHLPYQHLHTQFR